MVSIKDVAQHAGVAISTVSKVLNNYPNVSEEMKEKVNKAVEELNFVPNSVAAALSSKQAGRVALLINLNVKTNAIDEIAMQFIIGALDKAMELNLDVITLFVFHCKWKTVDELIRYLNSQSITGIIIYGLSKGDIILNQLIDSETFKCVVVDAPVNNHSTSSICIDHKQAQYDVAKKTILENHCKKVLYITGRMETYVAEARLRAMEELEEELDLTMIVKRGNFSEVMARNITLKHGKDVDVVICASDLMAIGAMKAFMNMGIFRPICGFDGVILMAYVGKQMNTVRQNFAENSARAVEELQRLMNGAQGRTIEAGYSLVQMKYEDCIT